MAVSFLSGPRILKSKVSGSVRGSNYPIFEVSGSQNPTLNGIWDQSPEILGTWTLWVVKRYSTLRPPMTRTRTGTYPGLSRKDWAPLGLLCCCRFRSAATKRGLPTAGIAPKPSILQDRASRCSCISRSGKNDLDKGSDYGPCK